MPGYKELVAHDQILKKQLDDQQALEIESVLEFIKQTRDAGSYIREPQQREHLRTILRYWGAFVYEHEGEFPATQLTPYIREDEKSPRPALSRSYRVLAPVAFALLITVILILRFYRSGEVLLAVATPTPTPTATPLPTATSPMLALAACNFHSLYGFESDTMGWKPNTTEGTRAVLQVKQSTKQARSGKSSLELQVELVGGTKNNANGEVFVDLRFNPPLGLKAPLDMKGVPIVIWVYVPKEAVGNPEKPNGVQVFVKDQRFRGEYGEWRDLNNENSDTWIAIDLMPAKDPPSSGVMDPGFDPSQIVWIGMKIGVGTGSATTYTGPIWVDDVCWPLP